MIRQLETKFRLNRDQSNYVVSVIKKFVREAPSDQIEYVRKNRSWTAKVTNWGGIGGTLSSQEDLQAALELKFDKANIITLAVTSAFSATATATLSEGFVQSFTPPESGNNVYALEMQMVTDGNSAGDFKFSITKTGLSTAELLYSSDLDNTAATTSTWASVVNIATAGLGQKRIGVFKGFLRIPSGSTSGDFNFLFAQQTSNAQPSTLSIGSFIRFTKIV